MLRLAVISLVLFIVSCSRQIKIMENNKTLVSIDQFPKSDTMIMVKDYFIKYREEGPYIIGTIESPYSDGNGKFKSSISVTIDISDGKLSIF